MILLRGDHKHAEYILKQDKNWNNVCLDGIEKEHFFLSKRSRYFAPTDGRAYVEMRWDYYTLAEMHIGVMPGYKETVEFARAVMEEVKHIRKLTAPVLDTNRAAKMLLKKLGFTLEGRITQAVQKNGKPVDLLIYGYLNG